MSSKGQQRRENLLRSFLPLIKRLQNLLDEARLRQCAYKLETVVDHGLRYSLHLVALGKVDEL